MTSSASPQIFLCHASEDKARVRQAYRVLKHAGYRPWLDEEELFPGQDWELEIPAALRASEAVVVFLSKVSVSKRGYVQREFRLALDALQEIPQGRIFVIPIKLDDCDVPPLFRNLQWSEWTDGLERVLESLTRRLGETARNGTSTVTVPNERMIALARHDPGLAHQKSINFDHLRNHGDTAPRS